MSDHETTSGESPADDPRSARAPGGVIHTYLGYDPARFPSPTKPPPDLVSGAFDHMLAYGSARTLTPEELARAVRLDPEQIAGLGPSLDAIIERLEERKRRILAKYETETVQQAARDAFHRGAREVRPPRELEKKFRREVRDEQLRGLERIWYQADHLAPDFAAKLPGLIERLGEKYEVDALAATYVFTGRMPLTVAEAIAIKEELEAIDRLLEQLREARKNAQIAIVDLDELTQFVEQADVDALRALREQVEDYVREEAARQGIEHGRDGYNVTPKAMRLYQSRLLSVIFDDISAARSGRHAGPIAGEGAVELPTTRPYEFGDSVAHMDVTQTMINAMVRRGGAFRDSSAPAFRSDDIEIHRTRNSPKCATAVILDMSGSMRYGGLYIAAKRMALALDVLIRTEYPGDALHFVEMYSFGRLRPVSELVELMPKPVTIHSPVVRLKADMSDDQISELDIPPHFTNIQHSLQLARQVLAAQDTPNRQVILLTDGLPTAHFEGSDLYLLYPPDRRTEEQTMREARACANEGVTINIFLLPTWSQSEEDVQFAQRMAEATAGRVFFVGGGDLDRFVVWDYVKRRRSIIG